MNGQQGSFSSRVKEELIRVTGKSKSQKAAELAAVFLLSGGKKEENKVLFCSVENEALARKVFTLLKKTYNINGVLSPRKGRTRGTSGTEVWLPETGTKFDLSQLHMIPEEPTEEWCRAFMRGAFLVSGTLTDPKKAYRFEIVCKTRNKADIVSAAMQGMGASPKQVTRGKDTICYVQDGTNVAALLGAMGAGVSYLTLENERVVREVRGQVNRKVNCETANLKKAVLAGLRQCEEVAFLKERGVLAEMPDTLKEVGRLRLENPDATYAELGEMLDPPIGRSGVRHRLNTISDMAEALKASEDTLEEQDK